VSLVADRIAEMRRRGWLTLAGAAAEGKVDRATIYRWIKAEKLDATKVAGSRFVSQESLRRELGPMAGSRADGRRKKEAKRGR
jgi:hypothetical protein